MDWGLKNRIGRIISPADNKALMLAVDHKRSIFARGGKRSGGL